MVSPIGVAVTVALGLGIGARIVNPGIGPEQLLLGVFFWSALVGFLVHLYQIALNGVRWPWERR
jgi:hypothetical protein